MTTGPLPLEIGVSDTGRALAAGAASAPAMRPAVARRVMRCETFMRPPSEAVGVDAADALPAR